MFIWTMVLIAGLCTVLCNFLAIKYKDRLCLQNVKLWQVLTAAFVLRLLIAFAVSFFEKSTHMDMYWWIEWTKYFSDNSVKNYYLQWIGDYPPGYMYWLKLVSVILGERFAYNGHLAQLLYKLPPMLFDVLGGWFVYRISENREKQERIFYTCLYVFQPVVLLLSTLWGQIDGVYALLIAMAAYCLSREKIQWSAVLTSVSILIKLQSLVWGVCFAFGILLYIVRRKGSLQAFLSVAKAGALSLLILLLGMLPCGIKDVLGCIFRTLGSYQVACLNAANFWALVGQNQVSQEETFLGIRFATYGTIFLLISIVAVLLYCIQKRERREVLFVGTAFMYLFFFTFEVRMHERYGFGALLLLLCGFVVCEEREILRTFTIFSTLFFLNCAWSLTLVSRQELATASFRVLGFFVVLATLVEWIRIGRIKE